MFILYKRLETTESWLTLFTIPHLWLDFVVWLEGVVQWRGASLAYRIGFPKSDLLDYVKYSVVGRGLWW